jgi:hypothetical protein
MKVKASLIFQKSSYELTLKTYIKVGEISSHKEINRPFYCSLLTIKCQKLRFEEFQDGFSLANKGVLPKK